MILVCVKKGMPYQSHVGDLCQDILNDPHYRIEMQYAVRKQQFGQKLPYLAPTNLSTNASLDIGRPVAVVAHMTMIFFWEPVPSLETRKAPPKATSNLNCHERERDRVTCRTQNKSHTVLGLPPMWIHVTCRGRVIILFVLSWAENYLQCVFWSNIHVIIYAHKFSISACSKVVVLCQLPHVAWF